jgi:hypothetical protein
MRGVKRVVWVAALAALTSCTEAATAPGKCPDFCPPKTIALVDTILPVVFGDSSFLGYVTPNSAPQLPAVEGFGGINSRPFFRTQGILAEWPFNGDTTPSPFVSMDSMRLIILIERWDTATHNLKIRLYRLPNSIDSTATYAQLDPAFTDSLIKTVNVDSILQLPVDSDGGTHTKVHRDSAGGDIVTWIDSASHTAQVSISLDSTQARYIAADSGKQTYGIRISADSIASVGIGAQDGGAEVTANFYATYDSAKTGKAVVPQGQLKVPEWDAFVFDPPPVLDDTTLTVGGAPAARSIMRVNLSRALRDSVSIVRATLVLVPAGPVVSAPDDSMGLWVRRALVDFGAKSPLAQPNPLVPADSTAIAVAVVPTGVTDTINVEITQMIRFWQADTIAPHTLVLMEAQSREGGTFASLRLFSSRVAAYRPVLHITYIPRYAFGTP